MRRYMAATVIIALNFMLTQCDMDKAGLFSNFFTTVTHTANASDYFQHVDGERFFFYVMRADDAGSDLVYVIQALPNGERKLAIYSEVLKRLTTAVSPDFGSGHGRLSSAHHLAGRVEVDVSDLSNITFQADSGAPADLIDRDGKVAYAGGSVYELSIDNSLPISELVYREFVYSEGNLDPFGSPGGNINSAISAPSGSRFVIDMVWADYFGMGRYLLRDPATNVGFVVQTTFPPGGITPKTIYPEIRLVAGTGRECVSDQSIVAQADDGTLRRISSEDGNAETEVPSSSYNDFLIAYPQNNTMYLFSPSSFSLFKGRAWWEYN